MRGGGIGGAHETLCGGGERGGGGLGFEGGDAGGPAGGALEAHELDDVGAGGGGEEEVALVGLPLGHDDEGGGLDGGGGAGDADLAHDGVGGGAVAGEHEDEVVGEQLNAVDDVVDAGGDGTGGGGAHQEGAGGGVGHLVEERVQGADALPELGAVVVVATVVGGGIHDEVRLFCFYFLLCTVAVFFKLCPLPVKDAHIGVEVARRKMIVCEGGHKHSIETHVGVAHCVDLEAPPVLEKKAVHVPQNVQTTGETFGIQNAAGGCNPKTR